MLYLRGKYGEYSKYNIKSTHELIQVLIYPYLPSKYDIKSK